MQKVKTTLNWFCFYIVFPLLSFYISYLSTSFQLCSRIQSIIRFLILYNLARLTYLPIVYNIIYPPPVKFLIMLVEKKLNFKTVKQQKKNLFQALSTSNLTFNPFKSNSSVKSFFLINSTLKVSFLIISSKESITLSKASSAS